MHEEAGGPAFRRSRCPAILRGSQCFLDVGHLGMHTTDLRGVLWRDGEEETPMVLVKLDVKTMQPAASSSRVAKLEKVAEAAQKLVGDMSFAEGSRADDVDIALGELDKETK